MIEMRWLTRQSDLDVGWGGKPVYEKERVLQYRYMIDVSNLLWSNWLDIPEIEDSNLEDF